MSAPLFLAPEPVVTPAHDETLAPCSGDFGRNGSMRTGVVPSSPYLETVVEQLDGSHFLRPFVVQTCGHTPTVEGGGLRASVCDAGEPLCREMTALVVAGTLHDPVRAVEREAIAPVARRAGVPLFSLQYDPSDHMSPAVAMRNGVSVARDIRGFRLALASDQASHFSAAHPRCYREEGRSDRSQVAKWSEPFERTLRKVPTTRTVSVDGAMVCDSCGECVGVVDVRSSEESHRRNRVSLLLALANPLGVPVIQVEHHPNPSKRNPSRISVYEAVEEARSVSLGTIYDVAGELYDLSDQHQCNVGGH